MYVLCVYDTYTLNKCDSSYTDGGSSQSALGCATGPFCCQSCQTPSTAGATCHLFHAVVVFVAEITHVITQIGLTWCFFMALFRSAFFDEMAFMSAQTYILAPYSLYSLDRILFYGTLATFVPAIHSAIDFCGSTRTTINRGWLAFTFSFFSSPFIKQPAGCSTVSHQKKDPILFYTNITTVPKPKFNNQ